MMSGMSSPNPATFAVAVTKSDTTSFLQGQCRSLYIGGAGDVSAVVGGATVVFKAAPAGSVLPVECTRVNATATTATDIVALY